MAIDLFPSSTPSPTKPPASMYERIGGMETLQKLAAAFYARVETDPLLRPIFRKNLVHSQERQALFLAEVFGGPKEYSKKHGTLDLREIHAAHQLKPEHVEAWLDHMRAAMEEVGIPGSARCSMRCYFTGGADSLGDPLQELDDLLVEELRQRLDEVPSFVSIKGAYRQTLLDRAAGAWDVARVRLILSYGVGPNAPDGYLNSALYHAANRLVPPAERASESGQAVVEMLIEHGADLNAHIGVGEQTPLHMAARRGNVRVAEALLAAGANLDARDSKGETPLRRAVNCGHDDFARRLLARDADPNSPDRQGKTPLQAARTSKMEAVFVLNRR